MENNLEKLKIGFIFVLYKTPKKEIKRLKEEIKCLGFKNYKIYFIDNTKNNRGFAGGVNKGIRLALKDNVDLFVVANTDIAFFDNSNNLSSCSEFLEAAKNFDIWGYGVRQKGKVYYGGKIDKWQLSGGMIDKKPPQRFWRVDFVSGSLMFIKRKVIEKIGFFNEDYFMYYEDVDYCLRAKKAGFRVGIDSQFIYEHFEVSSTNPQKGRFLAESHKKFFNQNSNLFQKAYKKIKSSRFLLNFFSLNFSSFVNKFLHFILFLFLVRYLSPSEYGIYTLVWAHIGLLMPFLDFGTTSYGLVYLPIQSQKNILALFSLRLFLSLIVFILTIFLAIFFRYPSQTFLFIFLTAFVVLANSFSGSFLILCSIKEKLYISSLVSFLFNFILIVFLILSLIFFKNLFNIFLINFVGYNLYSLINAYFIRKELGEFRFIGNLNLWGKILQKSTIFLLISFLANLYFKLDVFLLNFLKDTTAVGLYSSGYKFLEASLIIASSYNVSSLPILSKLQKGKREIFIDKIKRDFLFVAAIGWVFASLLFFLAPTALPIVLPGTYWQSIKVLQIVIFSLPFILATSVFLNSLYVLGKQSLVVFIFLFQAIFNFILNYLFIPRYSYFASAYITLMGEILNAVISFLILKKVLYENKH